MARGRPLMELPDGRLDEGGWSLVRDDVETLFRLSTVRVRGHTRLYEDRSTRTALAEATGLDRTWRFFFASRLEFEPPLPPGVGPAMVQPTVWSEARRSFADDLRERGLRDVDRTHTERMRVESGERARLQGYRGRLPLPLEAVAELVVAGWLAVWATGGEFRVAGGAYPEGLPAVADALGAGSLGPTAADCRRELFDLIRGVG